MVAQRETRVVVKMKCSSAQGIGWVGTLGSATQAKQKNILCCRCVTPRSLRSSIEGVRSPSGNGFFWYIWMEADLFLGLCFKTQSLIPSRVFCVLVHFIVWSWASSNLPMKTKLWRGAVCIGMCELTWQGFEGLFPLCEAELSLCVSALCEHLSALAALCTGLVWFNLHPQEVPTSLPGPADPSFLSLLFQQHLEHPGDLGASALPVVL